MNILLINPWITDFAAHDLWSRPLGLLYAGAFLAQRGHSLRLIDCMDRFQDSGQHNVSGTTRQFGTGKYHREVIGKPDCFSSIPQKFCRYGIPVDLFRNRVLEGPRPDVVLVTCIMTYWYPGAFDAISIIHELLPGVPVVLGGIYATLCPVHARDNSGADEVFTGSEPSGIVDMAESIGGKTGGGPVTPSQFNHWPEPLWNLYKTLPAAVTMTTRGCPMRCTVCASQTLFNGFERRNPSQAVSSIASLAERGVNDIAFYDDALLIDACACALSMFEELAHRKLPVRLHTPNGLHVRAITAELAALMKRAGIVTVRLSLETASAGRARDFSGKVNRGDFITAAAALFDAGYTAGDLGAYILLGLPGQTMDEVNDTVEFVLETGIPVKPALFSPVPGTVEFDRAAGSGMIRYEDDPLLHNNSLRKYHFWEGENDTYTSFRTALSEANERVISGV